MSRLATRDKERLLMLIYSDSECCKDPDGPEAPTWSKNTFGLLSCYTNDGTPPPCPKKPATKPPPKTKKPQGSGKKRIVEYRVKTDVRLAAKAGKEIHF